MFTKKYFQKTKFYIEKEKLNIIFIFFILFISIVNLRYFFQPGIMQTHDSENHLARIANYYLAIKDKQFPPRWAKNLNHKFGYPIFNYNYPLANIVAYPLIVIGFNIEDSLKIILFFAYLFSGLFFFLWAKKRFNNVAAFIGAIFYLCAPYQFLDIYIRGVVGENLSLALFPAVLYSIDLLSEKKTRCRFLALIIFVFLFSLSHNIMVLIFTPFMIGYTLFYRKKIKFTFLAIFLGFLLTSFFWLPALGEKNAVNINAFDLKTFYQDHFIAIKQLFNSSWQFGYSEKTNEDTMPFQIGKMHLLATIFMLCWILLKFVNKTYKREKIITFTSIVILLLALTIFLMTDKSQFIWQLIPTLGYLQFPWRFLSLTIFFTSLLAVILTDKNRLVGIILAMLALLISQNYVKPFSWIKKADIDYYDFLFTTTVRHEFNPIWFQEEQIDTFKNRFLSLSGMVSFNELKWQTGKHIYEINVPASTFIWEHTAFFPGWEVFIDDQRTKIEYLNNQYSGLIGFHAPAGKHLIVSRFTEKTPYRIIGNSLSVLTLLFILAVLKSIHKKRWQ